MIVVNQNTKMISITRGDTAFIGIKPKYRDTKEPYQFEAGDVVMFRFVKNEIYFEKRCEIDTVQNNCILSLSPEDTIGLPFDVYTYEIELIPISGGRFTFIAQKMFNVTFEVEKHILTAITESTYTAPVNNQAAANNTLLTADLRAMDVLEGDVDRTNGSVIEVIRKTTAEWAMFEDNVSKDGEIYVYTDYRTIEGVDLSATKIGDGETTIGELPFATLPITEDDIQTWNAAVQDANYVHTDNNYDDTAKSIVDGVTEALAGKVDKIPGKGLSTNDYDSTAKNKVDSLGTASTRDVPESGNASTSEVVLGSDTRLSDSRNAKDVYAWAKASTKPSYTASEVGAIASTMKGTANGVAELDANGKVPSAQLPSYVDDVLEYPSLADFPASGASGKIYIALDTNKTYRWSGTTYVEISESLALGETASTAYAGNKGKANADNIAAIKELIPSGAAPSNKFATENDIPDISGKVDKVPGKGLSTNDYTTEEKTKLAGISEGANKVESSETNGNIQIDGTETQVYDDTEVKDAISDIDDIITTDETTVEGNPINFSTKSAQTAKSTILSLEPIQDLHGFTKPWVGGAGRNFMLSTVEEIKARNTTGTWSGNTYTREGVEYTILTDSDNNVIGIKADKTATAAHTFFVSGKTLIENNTSYVLTGCPSAGASNKYRIDYRDESGSSIIGYDTGDGLSITGDGLLHTFCIRINTNTQMNNHVFYPMLRLATDTNPDFEPYTNICGISGRTEVGLLGYDNNLFSYLEFFDKYVTVGSSAVGRYTMQLKPNTNYVASTNIYGTNNSKAYAWAGDADDASPSSSTNGLQPDTPKVVTTDSNGLLTVAMYTEPGNVVPLTKSDFEANTAWIKIEEGETATPYICSNNIAYNFDQTVYRGTLDVEGGVLISDRVIKDFGDYTYNYNSNNKFFYTSAGDITPTAKSNEPIIISSCYEYVGFVSNADMSNLVAGKLARGGNAQTGMTIKVKDTRYTDATTFKTALTGQKFLYEVETPITIPLTPHAIEILKGANYFSTDGDKITLTYRVGEFATLADLENAKDKIDVKIAESQILTDTETGKKYKLVVANGVLDIEEIIG